jgi:hypothetical protein
MTIQGWIVLGVVAGTMLYFASRFRKSLARKGSGAGCGCCGGGSCGKPKPGS